MTKYLTYEELMDLALKNYCNGGDSTYECIDRKMFESSEYYTHLTVADALRMFAIDKSIQKEHEAMADW